MYRFEKWSNNATLPQYREIVTNGTWNSIEQLSQTMKWCLMCWEIVQKDGCCDVIYTDGEILNGFRKRFLDCKRACKRLYAKEEFPTEYHAETPKPVDSSFMARKAEIREKADNLYKILVSVSADETTGKNAYEYVTTRREWLKDYLEKDNVHSMRNVLKRIGDAAHDGIPYYYDHEEKKILPVFKADMA